MRDDFGSFEGLQSFETNGIESTNLGDTSSFVSADSFSSFGMDGSSASATPSISSEGREVNSLEDYGMQVVQELISNGVAPTPYNYRIYYEKLLENKSQQFKDNAMQFVEVDQKPTDRQVALESKVLKAQNYMTNTLQQVSAILKNLKLLQDILRKHEKEVEATNNAIALQNIISIFQKELDKLGSVMEYQFQDVRNSCDRSIAAINDIGDGIICDSVYNVYNWRFLEKRVETELESIHSGGYKSSLLLVRTSRTLDKRVTSEKTALLINRSLSKNLQKIANKSDVIAYREGGVFGVLLSHRDKDSAKHFANRLIEKIVGTNIIIGDEEISLSVCTGIVEIGGLSKPQEIMKNAIEVLKKALNGNISFVVYGEN